MKYINLTILLLSLSSVANASMSFNYDYKCKKISDLPEDNFSSTVYLGSMNNKLDKYKAILKVNNWNNRYAIVLKNSAQMDDNKIYKRSYINDLIIPGHNAFYYSADGDIQNINYWGITASLKRKTAQLVLNHNGYPISDRKQNFKCVKKMGILKLI